MPGWRRGRTSSARAIRICYARPQPWMSPWSEKVQHSWSHCTTLRPPSCRSTVPPHLAVWRWTAMKLAPRTRTTGSSFRCRYPGNTMSPLNSQSIFADAAGWNLWDVNARVGPSGIHGELALDGPALLHEMDRFYIRTAVVAHATGVEYDEALGNQLLSDLEGSRLIPAWTALADRDSVDRVAALQPKVVRLSPGKANHNFPLSAWGAGELMEFL